MANRAKLKTHPVNARVTPASDEASVFVDSAELGEQIEGLHREQTEIDRRAAEELARLRELQDRD
jgi:hypothetical protein